MNKEMENPRSSTNPQQNKYKEATPNHIIIKFLNNDKEKLLKAAGEREHVTYRIKFSTYTALKPYLFCLMDFHK